MSNRRLRSTVTVILCLAAASWCVSAWVAAAPAGGPRPTSYTDDFTGDLKGWPKDNGYTLSQAGGVLTMNVDKSIMWDGQKLSFDAPHDFSAHPYVNFKVKAETPCILSVYFVDGKGAGLVSQRVRPCRITPACHTTCQP